jgi:transglutaminase-like putative cysteine protease
MKIPLRSWLLRLGGMAAILLPSVLLSCALTLGLGALFSYTPSPGMVFAVTAGWCIFFYIAFSRVYSVIITLTLAVVAGAVVLITGQLTGLAQSFAAGSPALTVLLSALFSALVVGLSRRRVLLSPLVILTAGIFILVTATLRQVSFLAIILAVTALICYTARSALHRWSASTNALSECHIALWVLPVAIALSLFSWALVSPFTSLPKWEKLAFKFDFVREYLLDMAGSTTPRTSFSLVPTGMQPKVSQLGGPVEEKDDPVLEVTSSDPSVLLRASVYDSYNGHIWYNTGEALRYKFSDGADRNRVFGPALEGASALASQKVRLRITHLADGPSSLFVPFRVDAVTPSQTLTLLIYFNDRGEVFSTRDMQAGLGYSVEATLPTTSLSAISQWLSQNKDVSDSQYASALAQYTALPDTVPLSVSQLARSLTAGTSDSAEAVLALARYLAANTTYSLTPDVPPADTDFVAHFLETKTGYCTYYASAITVMARSLGIPARYVEGYQLPEGTLAGQSVTVTQKQAHAWAEVYFKGIGWIPVDVSAGEENQGASSWEEESVAPEPTPTPTPQQAQSTPQPTTAPVSPEEKSPSSFLKGLLWGLLALLAVTALILGGPLWRRWQEKKRCATAAGAYQCHYEAVLRLLAYLGYAMAPGETLHHFALRVDDALPLRRSFTLDMAKLVAGHAYGPDPTPTAADAEALFQYRRRLVRLLRKTKGWWGYVLREELRLIH